MESTKRVLNMHLERAVLATLDFALSAENQSFADRGLPRHRHQVQRRQELVRRPAHRTVASVRTRRSR